MLQAGFTLAEEGIAKSSLTLNAVRNTVKPPQAAARDRIFAPPGEYHDHGNRTAKSQVTSELAREVI